MFFLALLALFVFPAVIVSIAIFCWCCRHRTRSVPVFFWFSPRPMTSLRIGLEWKFICEVFFFTLVLQRVKMVLGMNKNATLTLKLPMNAPVTLTLHLPNVTLTLYLWTVTFTLPNSTLTLYLPNVTLTLHLQNAPWPCTYRMWPWPWPWSPSWFLLLLLFLLPGGMFVWAGFLHSEQEFPIQADTLRLQDDGLEGGISREPLPNLMQKISS